MILLAREIHEFNRFGEAGERLPERQGLACLACIASATSAPVSAGEREGERAAEPFGHRTARQLSHGGETVQIERV